MTVTISKPAINIREQLTELKAQQGYEERQFHFDNLVTNGTFDADTDWTKNVNWTISGGVATHTPGTLDYLQQIVGQTAGLPYTLSFDVSGRTAGTYSATLGGKNFVAAATANGSFSFTDIPTNANSLTFTADASFDGSIDNVSVYTSDGTDIAFTMPKGWKPLHVYDDGVLQREGSAEDYEVTFDGFNYYVKPTVANPGARNTVIGVRA